jgi:hypothetical protein
MNLNSELTLATLSRPRLLPKDIKANAKRSTIMANAADVIVQGMLAHSRTEQQAKKN